MELLRLRAEVNQLRQQTGQLASLRRDHIDLHRKLRRLEQENLLLRDATNTIPRVPRIGAWLGIAVQTLDVLRSNNVVLAANVPAEVGPGVMLVDIVPHGPANPSALKVGDFITAIDGTPVPSTEELKAILATKRGGDVLQLTVWRTNEYHTIAVQSRDWPQ